MDAEAPSHPPIYEALQKYFPQDGASILTKLRELRLANAPKSEGHAEAAKFWVSMREKYGDDTYFAADELLKKLIARRLELFEVLRDDPLGCAGFLLRGEQALTPLELFPLSEPSIALAATTVEVMYHGRTTPQNRASMSYMVYDRMFDSLKDVLTEKDLLLLDQPDAKNRRSCEVYRLYLRAALNADFDGADRLRAQMALDMQYGSPYRLKWPARPANAAVSVPLPSSPASTANMRRVENWARTSTDADADAAADEDMRGFFTEELSMDLTYPAIKRYFPQDVAAMQAKYRELKRADVPRPGMAAEGVKFTASLREKYAAAIHVAPDAALKKLLASRLALLDALRDDPLICNRVLMEGQATLTQQQQSSVSHLSDALAAAAAEAIHQGRSKPQNRAAMSPKTVERLFSLVQKDPKGLDLTLLRSPDLQNPRTCAVHRTYLRTILAVDFDEMETIRALSAQEMLRM